MKAHAYAVEAQDRSVGPGVREWCRHSQHMDAARARTEARRVLRERCDGDVWLMTFVPMVVSVRVRWHDGRRWHTSAWRKLRPLHRLGYRAVALETWRELRASAALWGRRPAPG